MFTINTHKLIKNCLYLFIIFSLIVPDIIINHLSQYIVIDAFFTVNALIIFLLLLLLTLFNNKIDFFLIIVFFFFIWRTLSSVLLHGGMHELSRTLRILSLVLFVSTAPKKDLKLILKIISYLMSFYVVLNFITMLVFPNGLYSDNMRGAWILGIGNQFGFFMVPTIIMNAIVSWIKVKKISYFTIFIAIISFFSAFLADSMTGVTIITILTVMLLLLKYDKYNITTLNFNKLMIIYLLVWLFLILFNNFEFFEYLFVEVLNRNMTLSGRTSIWNITVEEIKNSLFVGHGINTEISLLNGTNFVAHNLILQVLLDSGIIGFGLFLILFLISGRKLNKNSGNKLALILSIGIFSILVGGLTESYRLTFLILFLALAYNINLLNYSIK